MCTCVCVCDTCNCRCIPTQFIPCHGDHMPFAGWVYIPLHSLESPAEKMSRGTSNLCAVSNRRLQPGLRVEEEGAFFYITQRQLVYCGMNTLKGMLKHNTHSLVSLTHLQLYYIVGLYRSRHNGADAYLVSYVPQFYFHT